MPSFPPPGAITVCEIDRDLVAADALFDDRAKDAYRDVLGMVFRPIPFQPDALLPNREPPAADQAELAAESSPVASVASTLSEFFKRMIFPPLDPSLLEEFDTQKDSPVFNFINNLSPIPPPKPSRSFRLIRCRNIVSENCNITCHLNEASIVSSDSTSNPESKLPQSIQNGVGSVESDKNQCADGKTDLNISQECKDLEGIILDQSGPKEMDSSHSGKDVHENQLSEQNKD